VVRERESFYPLSLSLSNPYSLIHWYFILLCCNLLAYCACCLLLNCVRAARRASQACQLDSAVGCNCRWCWCGRVSVDACVALSWAFGGWA
jgi:hypothetical protein